MLRSTGQRRIRIQAAGHHIAGQLIQQSFLVRLDFLADRALGDDVADLSVRYAAAAAW